MRNTSVKTEECTQPMRIRVSTRAVRKSMPMEEFTYKALTAAAASLEAVSVPMGNSWMAKVAAWKSPAASAKMEKAICINIMMNGRSTES